MHAARHLGWRRLLTCRHNPCGQSVGNLLDCPGTKNTSALAGPHCLSVGLARPNISRASLLVCARPDISRPHCLSVRNLTSAGLTAGPCASHSCAPSGACGQPCTRPSTACGCSACDARTHQSRCVCVSLCVRACVHTCMCERGALCSWHVCAWTDAGLVTCALINAGVCVCVRTCVGVVLCAVGMLVPGWMHFW